MADEKQTLHDFAAHPWLIGFEKKDDKQKLAAVVEQIKYLENLVGMVSVIVIFAGAVIATMMGLSIVTGSFNFSMLTSVFKLIGG